MESQELDKYKNRGLNLGVVLVGVVIALVIFGKQARDVKLLKNTKETEEKKNVVLNNIGKLEKKIYAYKRLLKNKDMEMIIGSISDMARESGVKIVSIIPEPEHKYQDYIKLPLSLVLSAFEYHSLGDFIGRIESHPDVYIIEDVRINPLSDKSGLTINLKLSSIKYAE